MISAAQVHSAYVDMYSYLRNYIWAFDTVEALAELEVAAYSRFPDFKEMQNKFNIVYRDIRDVCEEDEDLKQAVEAFKDIIEQDSEYYAKLEQVKEVI